MAKAGEDLSVRYGIDLALQPSFTAKLYLTRQIVCGQYSSCNSTRQLLRMPVTPYFPCPDDRLRSLETQVERIARATADEESHMLSRRTLAADISTSTVAMEFEAPEPLLELQIYRPGRARTGLPGRPGPDRAAPYRGLVGEARNGGPLALLPAWRRVEHF